MSLPTRRRRRLFANEAALFEADLDGALAELASAVRSGSMTFLRARHAVTEARAGAPGAVRTHSVISVAEELLFIAVTEAVLREAGWLVPGEDTWPESSPLRGVHPVTWDQDFSVLNENREAVLRAAQRGLPWLLNMDVKNFYPSLPHALVDESLAEAGVSASSREVMADVLAGVVGADRSGAVGAPDRRGMPVGVPPSNVLAICTLRGLDTVLGRAPHSRRFVDDINVLCTSREEAESLLEASKEWTSGKGLALNLDKSFVRPTADIARTHLLGTRTPLYKRTTRREEWVKRLGTLVHPAQRLAVRSGFWVGGRSELLHERVGRYLTTRVGYKSNETADVLGYLHEIGLPRLRADVAGRLIVDFRSEQRCWLLAASALHEDGTTLCPETRAHFVGVLEAPDAPIFARSHARAILGRLAPRGLEELLAAGFEPGRQSMEDADILVALSGSSRAFVDELLQRARPWNALITRAVSVIERRRGSPIGATGHGSAPTDHRGSALGRSF